MFPLGNVLLPSVVLPLHVFEERYRLLTRVCLDGDGEFGVVLIERGSEVGGGDIRAMVGTVARIVEAAELDDGRFALATVGVRRIRVHEWLPDDPYPRALVDDWDDPPIGDEVADEVADVVARLRRVLARHAELGDPAAPATVELSDDPVLASYQASALAPFGPSDHQALLAAPTVADRVARLERLLAEEEDFLVRRMALEAERPPGADDADGS
jgi:Lon protease-like protein